MLCGVARGGTYGVLCRSMQAVGVGGCVAPFVRVRRTRWKSNFIAFTLCFGRFGLGGSVQSCWGGASNRGTRSAFRFWHRGSISYVGAANRKQYLLARHQRPMSMWGSCSYSGRTSVSNLYVSVDSTAWSAIFMAWGSAPETLSAHRCSAASTQSQILLRAQMAVRTASAASLKGSSWRSDVCRVPLNAYFVTYSYVFNVQNLARTPRNQCFQAHDTNV